MTGHMYVEYYGLIALSNTLLSHQLAFSFLRGFWLQAFYGFLLRCPTRGIYSDVTLPLTPID